MKTRIIATITILSVCGAVWSVYHTLHPKPPPLKLGLFGYIGEVAFQKIVERSVGQPQVVLWRPKLSIPADRTDSVVNGFRAAAKKASLLSVIAEEQDPKSVDSLSGEQAMYAITADRLTELLVTYQKAEMIVLFCGSPQDLHKVVFPEPCPKVFIIQLADIALAPSTFTHRLCGGAIVPRRQPPTTNPQTDAERFEAYYEYIAPR